ncbi:MAG: hypothetical protein Unbinned4409contig1002_51 [Prokaryotic dsDNA virus sp.]|nr:MAG: hypothetical protein Unbinned4409contig1002_51 [Prokaryotic dsDNA virus sp.]|tara:strand:+ start:2825 stop:3286 length:462 start_codon:yes stop_codon:yes gene_type:complete
MKKNKSPFDIIKGIDKQKNMFSMRPKGGDKMPGFEPMPGGPGMGDLYTGPGNDEMDTDPGQYQDDTDYDAGNCYNLQGQEVPCGNCPDGSLVNMGQCIGGGTGDDTGGDTGGDLDYVMCPDGTFAASLDQCGNTDEGCSPQYNILGQCIACCD